MSDWKMDGKPALVLLHMQKGIASEGTFIPGWRNDALKAIKESGMIARMQDLLKAFRDKKLPVIFVSVLPNPIGTLPAYGKLFRKIEEAKLDANILTSASIRESLEVIPELGRRPEEPLLVNWLLGGFTNSGLDTVLKLKGVKTVVLAGFAAHQIVHTTAVQAADLWYSVIIPRDASISPPAEIKAYEAMMDITAPLMTLVTTTDDVIAHL